MLIHLVRRIADYEVVAESFGQVAEVVRANRGGGVDLDASYLTAPVFENRVDFHSVLGAVVEQADALGCPVELTSEFHQHEPLLALPSASDPLERESGGAAIRRRW